MRQLTFAMTICLLAAGQALAKDSTGCGWGTMVFDGKSGVGPQVLAVTTNGTFGNQTFGISSGTAGCDSGGTVTASEKLRMFANANMENLAQDMAAGTGESLTTMAKLMGIPDADRAAFYSATKANFGRIFSSADVTAEQVITSVKAVMAEDAALAHYVS